MPGYRKEPSAFLNNLRGTTGRPFGNNLLRHFEVNSPCSASAKSMRRRAAWSSSRVTCGSAFTISESLTLVLSETSILPMLSATSLANAANNGLVFPLVVDDLTAR